MILHPRFFLLLYIYIYIHPASSFKERLSAPVAAVLKTPGTSSASSSRPPRWRIFVFLGDPGDPWPLKRSHGKRGPSGPESWVSFTGGALLLDLSGHRPTRALFRMRLSLV